MSTNQRLLDCSQAHNDGRGGDSFFGAACRAVAYNDRRAGDYGTDVISLLAPFVERLMPMIASVKRISPFGAVCEAVAHNDMPMIASVKRISPLAPFAHNDMPMIASVKRIFLKTLSF